MPRGRQPVQHDSAWLQTRLATVRSRMIAPDEDRMLRDLFELCGGMHECEECPDSVACQRLSDKLVERASMIALDVHELKHLLGMLQMNRPPCELAWGPELEAPFKEEAQAAAQYITACAPPAPLP